MLSYIGGKSRIAKKLIIPNIPSDIEVYSEPFGGMYWTFFGMDLDKFKNLKKIIYNDFNKLNTNIFNCIKNHEEFNKVIKQVESQNSKLFYEFQSEVFNESLDIDTSVPDYELGCKYAYVLTQVFSGTNPEKAKFIDLKGKYKSKFDTFKGKLENIKWQNHFDKIDVVENLDFSEFIDKYDSESTYFYCDPPYFTKEKYYANHSFTLETHEKLANQLKGIKGKFSLSYYDFEKLSEWFPKDEYTWDEMEFVKPSMASAGKKQNKATEILIMNYDKINK